MVGEQGRVPKPRCQVRGLCAPAEMCARLELPALSSVIQIRRARRIDERLVLYVEHYLNPQVFPAFDFDLTRSLTDLYASHYDIRYGRVAFDMVPTALPAKPPVSSRSPPAARPC